MDGKRKKREREGKKKKGGKERRKSRKKEETKKPRSMFFIPSDRMDISTMPIYGRNTCHTEYLENPVKPYTKIEFM